MKPNNRHFRFFICTLNPRTGIPEKCKEIFPANADQLRIIHTRESNRIFFRRKLSGNPVLINSDEITDYSLIKSFEPYSLANPLFKYIFKIQRLNGALWEDFWLGNFNIIGCKFDDDRCTVELNNIEPYDKYTCLLEMAERKYNLLDISELYECTCANIKFEIETETRIDYIKNCHGWLNDSGYNDNGGYTIWKFTPETGANNGSGSDDTTPKDALYTYPNYFAAGYAVTRFQWEMQDKSSMKFKLTTTFSRRTTKTADVNGLPVTPVESGTWVDLGATTISGVPAHKWYDSDYKDLVSKQTPTETNKLPNSLVWWWLHGTYYQWEIINGIWTWNSNFDTITHSRNRSFISAIEFIVNRCGLNLVSKFLTDSINYVTNDVNKLNNLLIASKYDIKRPDLTDAEPGTIAYYNFNNIETWLREIFNAYWYIDDNDNFIVEHILKFELYVGRNLKLLENGRYIIATNKYEYQTDSVDILERWNFMEAYGADFIGKDIYYTGTSVEGDERNVTVHDIPLITTDINYIQYVPSEISDEGFCLMACIDNNGTLEVINEVGLISNQIASNGHLSLANLHYNYHRHNRPMIRGYMNDKLINFITSKRIKKQIPVSFPLCGGDELDEFKLITTNLGNGEILEGEFSLQTEMQTVTLIY